MTQVRGKFYCYADGEQISFDCPGCQTTHRVTLRDKVNGERPSWTFNGDYDRPTFTPSILVKSGHYCSGQEGRECWCTFEQRFGRKPPFTCGVCHSFVTDGMIQFLSDCTHALAGQTVALPDAEARDV